MIPKVRTVQEESSEVDKDCSVIGLQQQCVHEGSVPEESDEPENDVVVSGGEGACESAFGRSMVSAVELSRCVWSLK